MLVDFPSINHLKSLWKLGATESTCGINVISADFKWGS